MLKKGAWIFYLFAVIAAAGFVVELSSLVQHVGVGMGRFGWVRVIELPAIAALTWLTGQGLRRERAWALWLGCAQAAVMILVFPVGTAMGLFVLVYLGAASRGRLSAPKVVLLPLLFIIVVAPLAVFVASGAGSEMSALMLYPFASPWWLFFRDGVPGTEMSQLLVGCAGNAALLALAGLLLDRRRRDPGALTRGGDV